MEGGTEQYTRGAEQTNGSTCIALQFFRLPPLGFGYLRENKAISGGLLEHRVRCDKSLCVGAKNKSLLGKGFFFR